MGAIELTGSQRELLATLVNEYQVTEEPVKGRVIAEQIGRNAGSVRNKMGSLTALGLAEGIPGQKGGYKPTPRAYDVLDYQALDDPERLVLAREYERADVTVDEIAFTNVHHPEKCRARIHFQQSVDGFDEGDAILVGPTPVCALVVGGTVEAVDRSTHEVILAVSTVEAPFEG